MARAKRSANRHKFEDSSEPRVLYLDTTQASQNQIEKVHRCVKDSVEIFPMQISQRTGIAIDKVCDALAGLGDQGFVYQNKRTKGWRSSLLD